MTRIIYWIILCAAVASIAGCTQKPRPAPLADSSATTNSVRQMEGKHFRVFRGPADILGDTTKNERKPAIVKQ